MWTPLVSQYRFTSTLWYIYGSTVTVHFLGEIRGFKPSEKSQGCPTSQVRCPKPLGEDVMKHITKKELSCWMLWQVEMYDFSTMDKWMSTIRDINRHWIDHGWWGNSPTAILNAIFTAGYFCYFLQKKNKQILEEHNEIFCCKLGKWRVMIKEEFPPTIHKMQSWESNFSKFSGAA